MMNFLNEIKVEACVYTLDDAIAAQKGGAKRIELNADRASGGCTPSMGMILEVVENVSMEVYVMIRPREGGFVYNDTEFNVMCRDLEVIKKTGADGVVFGMINENSTLDEKRMKEFVKRAEGLGITCHHAFDNTIDLNQSLDKLIEMGITRVLTAGKAKSYDEMVAFLTNLNKRAAGRIAVMPSTYHGVSQANVGAFMKSVGAKEIHIWDIYKEYETGRYKLTQDKKELLKKVDHEVVIEYVKNIQNYFTI